MLESYHEELTRKKRAARIFWLIVFVFAGFLYFFFQGYYPNIEFRLTNIGMPAVSGEDRGVMIRSFGIVNVKVQPENTAINLNNAPYGNNEKKMVDYGEYTLAMNEFWRLPYSITFTIDRERPFYIDSIFLVPKPRYLPYAKWLDQVARIDDNAWTVQNASGMTLFDGSFLTGMLISRGKYAHIGDGYFLSGATIVSYDRLEKSWIPSKNTLWNSFIKKCKTATIKNEFMFCPKTREGLSRDGKTLTGILEIQESYIKTNDRLFSYENGEYEEEIVFSGAMIGNASPFIFLDNQWYYAQSGSLLSITGKKNQIHFPLESLRQMKWHQSTLFVFGVKGWDTFLSLFDTNMRDTIRTIPFPDIPLDDLRIWEDRGNIFIKTKNALLLIYRWSEEILWIVDGEILTVGTDIALYRKDEKIWEAHWGEEIPQ
jgi:hypothetical protein